MGWSGGGVIFLLTCVRHSIGQALQASEIAGRVFAPNFGKVGIVVGQASTDFIHVVGPTLQQATVSVVMLEGL